LIFVEAHPSAKVKIRVVMATDRRTCPSVRSSITSDKVLVRQIRVNAMLTSDRIKPKLLYPRWLPRWILGCKLLLHYRHWGAHGCMGAHTAPSSQLVNWSSAMFKETKIITRMGYMMGVVKNLLINMTWKKTLV
jgi:hypothetical protein